MTQKRGAPKLVARHHRGETGDTLIEVLIAIVIISLSVVAVLGTLTETITSSAENRSLTTLDSVLKNFAEATKYDVQLQPASSSSYQDCAGQLAAPSIPVYRVVSTYPSTAAVGTGVTVFGTNFIPRAPVSVTVGGSSVPAANFVSGSNVVKFDGTVAASFRLPATASGSQAVSLSDGTNSAVSATALSVTPSTGSSAGSPVAGYSIGITSIGWWNSSTKAFDNSTTSTCAANDKSGIQEVNLVARAPSLASDSLSVVVTNPAFTPPNPAPAVSVVPSPLTPSAGQQIVFQATFTGSTGGTWPSGTVTWTFTNSPGNPTCANSTLSSTGTKTSTTSCTVASALPGIYQVAATYSGDVNYSATAGYGSVTVPKSTPTVAASVSPAHPVVGQTLTFTATITGANNTTPGGTVTWSFIVPTGAPAPACGSPNVTGGGNTGTNSCTIPNSIAGMYSGTATYSGDANYLSGTAQASTTVHSPFTITNVQLVNGSTGTAGKVEKGDSIVVTFSAPLALNTLCASLSLPLSGSAVVVTVTHGSGSTNDSVSVSDTGCPALNFGSINLGTNTYVSGTVTFSGSGNGSSTSSTVSWAPGTNSLTIAFGKQGGSGSTNTVPTSPPTYTASGALTDSFGDPLSNTVFTVPAGKQF